MGNFKWAFIAAIGAFLVSFGVGLIFGVAMLHVFLRALIFAAVFFGIGFGLRFLANSFFPEILMSDNAYEGQDSFDQQPGQRVNITLDTTGEYAVPELFKAPDTPDELDNINDLISGYKTRPEAIDRNREESYNQDEDFESGGFFPDMPEEEPIHFKEEPQIMPSYEKPQAEKPAAVRQEFNPSFGDGSDGLGGLPDLDAMAMAFSPLTGGRSDLTGGRPSGSQGAPSSDDFGGGFSDDFSAGEPPDSIFGSSFSDDAGKDSAPYVGNKPQPLKGNFNPKEIAEGIRTVLIKEK